jgi:iron complex transport system substrate-binding protein
MYKRIISLAPSNTEILYALNAQDRLVACTRYCDYPAEATKKPRVGGWLDIKEELIMKHKPDLLLTSTFVQNKITDKYKRLGLNIEALMPTTLVGVFNSIKKIGKFVGKDKEADNLVKSMAKKLHEIKEKSRFAEYTPRLYIEEWHKPPTISGNWVPTLAKIARANYSLIRAGHHSREISKEEIQKYNPEYIIISICGLNDSVPKEWITKRKGWENLSAVKNNRVFTFNDSYLNRPSPRIVTGLEMLANVLHPEIFHDKEIQEMIK